MGDPGFVTVPVHKLLAQSYLEGRAKLVTERAMALAPPGDPEAGTSHFSIVDANGDVVSMTTTIEAVFGSRIMVRGFLLNNQLTDFDFMPGGANAVAAGKRPRSSMAPAVVFNKENIPILVVKGYMLGGVPELPKMYVDYCLQDCTWRDTKYETVTPQRLKEIVEKFIAANPKANKEEADWLRRQAE